MNQKLNEQATQQATVSLLESPLFVVNLGLDGFAEDLLSQGASVVSVDWRPPADGDAELAELLSKLGC